MKKNKIIIAGISLGIIFGTASLYATGSFDFSKFTFNNSDAMCGTEICSHNDTWKMEVSNILIYDSDKSDYSSNQLRGLLKGTINSSLFGNFSIKSIYNHDNGLGLYNLENSEKCGEKQKTYKVEGTINSILFGELEVISDKSYFCPATKKSFLAFNSSLLPKKLLTNVGILDEDIVETEVEVDLTGTSVENIFEKQQVLILGSSSIKGSLDGLLNESGDTQINKIDSSAGLLPVIESDLNKKTSELLRDINRLNTDIAVDSSLNLNTPSVITNGEKIFYYDYKGKSKSSGINGNKGYIVKIGSHDFNDSNPTGYKTEINGKNTVIVEGANIYINSDIINADDKNSLLTIYVKRDSNNNGGNIYIDPDVTNIDAILIAEGSLLSYEPSKGILNRNDSNLHGLLSRQLYIYGSVFSKNVIGSDHIPFNTDHNLFSPSSSFTSKEENIYNLANLRAFQVKYANKDEVTSNCGNTKWLWTPGYTDDQKLDHKLTYAWAGKMKCFNKKINTNINNTGTEHLVSKELQGRRSIGKSNSVIIEYNPNIKNNIPYILQK